MPTTRRTRKATLPSSGCGSTGLVARQHAHVTFQYGTTKSGKHAYDYLTTWDWSEDWISHADRCEDITGLRRQRAETTSPIPNDPNVPDTIEPAARRDRVVHDAWRHHDRRRSAHDSSAAPTRGDSETVITISFTVGPIRRDVRHEAGRPRRAASRCGSAPTSQRPTSGVLATPWRRYPVSARRTTSRSKPSTGRRSGQRDNQMQAERHRRAVQPDHHQEHGRRQRRPSTTRPPAA